MLVRRQLMLTVMAGAAGLMASPALAQEAAQPADGALPEVEVVQPKAAPAAKKAPPAPKAATPTPQPPPAYDYVDAEPPAPGPGERGADGRVIGNAPNLSPVSPSTGILPTDLQNYSGAGTRVTAEQLEHIRPKDNHEILTRVPGVTVVQDDGMGRHINVSVRGSPARRGRKVLMLEDGQSINFSSYLDPSTHYTPPTERVESVEVLRGYNIPFAPLTNHGIVNFRNLNPFGPNETVISAAIGHTSGVDKDVNNKRHVHTRQNLGNVGVVASYSGGEAGGAWDNEVLRYNDFYGAIGFRGFNQDLTLSGVYFRQRDDYDENNWIHGDAGFFDNRRTKGGSPDFNFNEFNTYNADYYRFQAAHNWYIDSDTTLSTRFYGHDNERSRFQLNPATNMQGRERHYRYYGVDSRIELANRPLVGTITQDIQAGVSYEWHSFRNCNSVGLPGQVLKAGTSGDCLTGSSRFEKYDAESFTAFLQSAIHLTRDLTVTPGIRFVDYDVDKHAIHRSEPCMTGAGCSHNGERFSSSHQHVLPGIALAWEFLPQSTLYGGYHRGFTPSVARGERFPLPDEIGDNYQVGVRSSSIRGLTFDAAYFHSRIEDYQIKGPFEFGTPPIQFFGVVDEVKINGFEIYGRLDSQPYTGGAFNFFGEATYTFTDAEIAKSVIAAEVGNRVPEIPRHFAALTVGVEERGLWDTSVTWTHLGEFYVDTSNTESGATDSRLGLVPDVWLLSARANYHVPNTGLSLFVSGQNLTDKFYIADRSDGAKPGIGRTLWAGFTWKFDHD